MATFTTTDGVSLHYSDEGDGTPVVLIAGFTAPATTWELQKQALRAAGYRVIGFDRRSHGESDSPAWGQRLARHGADVRELLDALGLDRDVVLIGGSMGASTIWAYYDLFGADRLRAIVTVDQTPKLINDDTWAYGFYGLDHSNIGTFFDHGVPDTGRPGPSDPAAGFGPLVAALGAPPAFTDGSAPEVRGLLQDHAEKDWRDVVARIEVPSLFLAGRDSQLWPCEHAQASADLNKLARAVVLEDCGHFANLNQADRCNAAILEFLS